MRTPVLAVSMLVLLAAQGNQTPPVPRSGKPSAATATLPVAPAPDVTASAFAWEWTLFLDEAALHVAFGSSTLLVTGLGIQPGDDVRVLEVDVDHDGQRDLGVALSGPGGRRVHCVILDPGLPPVVDVGGALGLGSFELLSLVSDMDLFGFFPEPLPCAFFDNSGPGDVNVFDRELSGGDEVDVWQHDVSAIPQQPDVALFRIRIREAFSDPYGESTLTFEGSHTFDFEMGEPDCTRVSCDCSFRVTRTFIFREDPDVLLDGSVELTFAENGDNIALDYCELLIVGFSD